MKKVGFDTDVYINLQLAQIKEMLGRPAEKFYIEIGGKLIQDRHAARVLPGFREDARFEIVKNLSLSSEIILVVSAKDVLRGRIRGDFKITYDRETLRTINELKNRGLPVKNVVISLLDGKAKIPGEIIIFENELEKEGINHYRFFASSDHASSIFNGVDLERNAFVDVSARTILVISPGGGSGKFGICLSQLYHEMKRGVAPRYFSLGAFPIYELPINHPLNLAYMAASADIRDKLKQDPYAANSLLTEREIENYLLLRQMALLFEKEGRYLREISSATNMCVSSLAKGIVDEEEVQREAAAEIARRYMRYKFEVARGQEKPETLEWVKEILSML
ncbi:MAG TPA: DUF1846 domain-containing protein [Candidatus Paceibacterota bacterium]